MKITKTDPTEIRRLSYNSNFVSITPFVAKPDGHKYAVGERRELTGLEDFPEFNGKYVLIEAIRENGENGRCYYIKGEINRFLNWVYEYRLQ